MATTTTTTKKRTTTTKPKTTTAKTESKVEPVVEAKIEPKKEKRKFADSDGIVCRSIVQGGLFMEGMKTHMLYEWVDYGDVTQVEYADLASAVRVKSPFVFSPLFIIDDEDFVEEFLQLKKFYTENYTTHDLEKIIMYPEDRMEEEIIALPKSAKESLKVIAASSITDGVLDSMRKIQKLDELLGTNLNLLAEFKN